MRSFDEVQQHLQNQKLHGAGRVVQPLLESPLLLNGPSIECQSWLAGQPAS